MFTYYKRSLSLVLLIATTGVLKVMGLTNQEQPSVIAFAKEIKIGVYSGTFDPPTVAHNHIIRKAIDFLSLDRLK